jgi:hypothetical protein
MINTSENLDAFAEAFAKAQAELTNPPKNKVNPHFNSRYVDLSDGLDVIRKTFSKHGLAVIQGTSLDGDLTVLNTRILHKSGQWMEWVYPVSGLDTHQKMGSAMTYARRYALFGIVGVAGEDDDDGNAASAPAKPAKKMAEVGMTPAESEKATNELIAEIEQLTSIETMTRWAAANKTRKDKLLPADQKLVTEAFKIRQSDINNG